MRVACVALLTAPAIAFRSLLQYGRAVKNASLNPLNQKQQTEEIRTIRTLHENEVKMDSLVQAMGHKFHANSDIPCQPLFHEGSPEVEVVTVSTQDTTKCHPLIGWSPEWSYTSSNAGFGKEWHGQKTKVAIMIDWLSSVPNDRLIAFIDGSDVLYGGCDKNEFVRRYETLKNATGKSVFFGAERNCYDLDAKSSCYDWRPEDRRICSTDEAEVKNLIRSKDRSASLAAFGIKEKQIAAKEWSANDNLHSEMVFMNTGFVIGRASDLRKVYQLWQKLQKECDGAFHSDQGYGYEVMKSLPDLVTMDYTGALVNNLFETRSVGKDTGKPFMHWTGNKFINGASGMDVCFAHGNGPSKPVVQKLAETVKANQTQRNDLI